MALRGKKPTVADTRLKALFYGAAGVGKTMAAINFPTPYLIDTEKGSEQSQYVDLINERQGAVFKCSDPGEIIKEVKSLLSEKHPYKTIIIDPLTTVYDNAIDLAEKELGSEFGRHIGHAKKTIKHLLNLLLRLDMNVIITSHEKIEYGDGLVKLGTTFDCYKKLDYVFDLAFHVQKRGKIRVGIVKKTRVLGFAEGEEFGWSYDNLARKYGRELIEKEVVPEALATAAQVSQLNNLVSLMHLESETINKWLSKAHADSFEELPETTIIKIIESLTKKIDASKDTQGEK